MEHLVALKIFKEEDRRDISKTSDHQKKLRSFFQKVVKYKCGPKPVLYILYQQEGLEHQIESELLEQMKKPDEKVNYFKRKVQKLTGKEKVDVEKQGKMYHFIYPLLSHCPVCLKRHLKLKQLTCTFLNTDIDVTHWQEILEKERSYIVQNVQKVFQLNDILKNRKIFDRVKLDEIQKSNSYTQKMHKILDAVKLKGKTGRREFLAALDQIKENQGVGKHLLEKEAERITSSQEGLKQVERNTSSQEGLKEAERNTSSQEGLKQGKCG